MKKTPEWNPPLFCDYDCIRAAFSPPAASGACRREQAVWCTYLKRFNNKNAKCLVPARTSPVPGTGTGPRRAIRGQRDRSRRGPAER